MGNSPKEGVGSHINRFKPVPFQTLPEQKNNFKPSLQFNITRIPAHMTINLLRYVLQPVADNFAESQENISKCNMHNFYSLFRRMEYSRKEDINILLYVKENRGKASITGNTFWKKLEDLNVGIRFTHNNQLKIWYHRATLTFLIDTAVERQVMAFTEGQIFKTSKRSGSGISSGGKVWSFADAPDR